jgi:prolyl oligopeptidase PreP (S9A serine peptidase family)
MERGGVYVQANIRGGGEYGPDWHTAATKQKRQTAYDDLAAVAEDLVKRGVTTSKTLGVMGGSNGGLLTSVMLTQRPELFGAVVSKVPLTDMKRYHKLLAGASWMAEYGDPDKPDPNKKLGSVSGGPVTYMEPRESVSTGYSFSVSSVTLRGWVQSLYWAMRIRLGW